MLRVFNVLRCSVLYILWLHHNDRMMNGVSTNTPYVLNAPGLILLLSTFCECMLMEIPVCAGYVADGFPWSSLRHRPSHSASGTVATTGSSCDSVFFYSGAALS